MREFVYRIKLLAAFKNIRDYFVMFHYIICRSQPEFSLYNRRLNFGHCFCAHSSPLQVTKARVCSPFTGGGITLPWEIALDGNDTVWVFNFGAVKVGTSTTTPTRISRFCGVDTKKCPPGMRVGDPISPDTGYRSDALQRITGGQIDPSGNVWLTNNWKIDSDGFVNPECRRDRHWRGRTGEDATDRAASFV